MKRNMAPDINSSSFDFISFLLSIWQWSKWEEYSIQFIFIYLYVWNCDGDDCHYRITYSIYEIFRFNPLHRNIFRLLHSLKYSYLISRGQIFISIDNNQNTRGVPKAVVFIWIYYYFRGLSLIFLVFWFRHLISVIRYSLTNIPSSK